MASQVADPAPPKTSARWWAVWWTAVGVIITAFLVTLFLIVTRRAPLWWIGPLIATFNIAIFSLAFRAQRQTGAKRRRLNAAGRRFLLRFMPAMGLYVIVLFISIAVQLRVHPTGVLAWIVALAPAVPILGALAALSMFLTEEDDEFERQMMTQGFVLATSMLLALCTVWGFLETFQLVPHIPLWATFPALAVLFAPAQFIVRWKYR